MPRNPNPPTKSLPPWDTWIQQATQEKSKGSMGRESAYKQREQARMNVMAPQASPAMRKYDALAGQLGSPEAKQYGAGLARAQQSIRAKDISQQEPTLNRRGMRGLNVGVTGLRG